MMRLIIFDTNVWLYLLRGTYRPTAIKAFLPPEYQEQYQLILPAAVKAELFTLGIRRNWSENRLVQLEYNLQKESRLIHTSDAIIERYLEIEAFNKGKYPNKSHGTTHIEMGKNDIWIAATALDINALLVTSDNDFNHLTSLLSIAKIPVPPK